ncbi:MAG: hypothetical protein HOW73_36560 [Polyangiaceae bacterium]|nr:hypothetical protein [Polyangiaceae bacterium]
MNAARASSILMCLACACSAPGAATPEPETPPVLSAAPTVAPKGSSTAPARAPRTRDNFAVAAENASAVEVARSILESGGSATDAAIAAVLVGCAAHASSCGLGGGGSALLYRADPKRATEPVFVDFRESAPSGIKPVDYLTKNPPPSRRGFLVGVPGLVAGLAKLHEIGGKLPWKTVVGSAADAIERGVPLSPYMAQVLAWNDKWRSSDDRARSLWPDNAEARVGETLHNEALVRTLRTIADAGPSAFYKGAIAKDVLTTARDANSRMTPNDLATYEPIVRKPLHAQWEGLDIVTAPPPSGGGLVISEMFEMFDKADVKKLEHQSGTYVHVLSEGLRNAYFDRSVAVGDPAFFKTDITSTLDESRLRARRAKIRVDTTNMPKLPSISDSGTFHCDVVDDKGDAVSITASLTSMFGSKLLTAGGFALNDALGEFSIDEYGQRVTTRGPNFPRGGARPVSNHVPTIVLRDGAPIVVAGASGGLRGTTGVVSVLMAHLAFGMPLSDAVAEPRFHVTASGALRLDAPLDTLREDLVARGEVVDAPVPGFGAVTAISVRNEDGVRALEPVFDPRKGGAVTVGR